MGKVTINNNHKEKVKLGGNVVRVMAEEAKPGQIKEHVSSWGRGGGALTKCQSK